MKRQLLGPNLFQTRIGHIVRFRVESARFEQQTLPKAWQTEHFHDLAELLFEHFAVFAHAKLGTDRFHVFDIVYAFELTLVRFAMWVVELWHVDLLLWFQFVLVQLIDGG